jgi:hypothetical protein
MTSRPPVQFKINFGLPTNLSHTPPTWHRTGIVSGLRYNDKGETLYHRPDPDNPPPRPKIGRPAKIR